MSNFTTAEYCHFSNEGFGAGIVYPGNCAPWWGWEDVWNPGDFDTSWCPSDVSGGGGSGGGGGGKRPKPDPIDTQQQYKKGGRLKRGKHRTKPVGRGM
jgi:hypothetical protein